MTTRRLARAPLLVSALTASVLALTAGATRAGAQLPGVNPFHFGVEAGPAFPVGAFGRLTTTGFAANGLLEVRAPLVPLGARFEVGLAQFGGEANLGTARVVSGTADAVFRLNSVAASLVRPYLIGGVGIYNGNQGRGTAAGLNVGGGLSVPLAVITAFADARYTRVYNRGTRVTFIPVRVGVRF